MDKNWQKHTGLKDPTCALKFSYSTVKLSEGTSASCHRTTYDKVPEGDFGKFHHTPTKMATRKLMLEGKWPGKGCEYCKKMEDAGAISDRMEANSMDPKHFSTTDCKILEMYFSNVCNQACIYCSAEYSSKWETENKKFGLEIEANDYAVDFLKDKENFKRIKSEFWEWMEDNHKPLVKYNILGGEPFFQPELLENLDFFETHPCPNLELTIVSNLKCPEKRFRATMDKIDNLRAIGNLGQVRITCSIDSWGPSYEYIRWGGKSEQWEKNFSILVKEYPEVEPEIHMTMNAMSIKTQPELVNMLNKYNTKENSIWISANFVVWPYHMAPDIFPTGFFKEDFKRLYKELDDGIWASSIKEMMLGYEKSIDNTPVDYVKINKLKEELTNIDRRRGCDWKKTFPWLDELYVPKSLGKML
jgi:wyosine [tRNA(Phe)-imidazoG37] synthetase (radical SAM superfamily)